MRYLLPYACILCLAVVSGCDTPSSASSGTTDAEYERQSKESARQLEVAAKQLKDMERQYQRADQQAEQFEKLLKRWTEQADRYDRILQRWEQQPAPPTTAPKAR